MMFDKVDNTLDKIKEQNPSRQRYYFAMIGFVLGAVVTSLFWMF